MRVIEKQMVKAITERKAWRKDNTEVYYDGMHAHVKLFGHTIATVYGGEDNPQLWITLAGWNTPTTRSRLTALIRHFVAAGPEGLGISTKKEQAYLHDAAGKRPIDDAYWTFVHRGE